MALAADAPPARPAEGAAMPLPLKLLLFALILYTPNQIHFPTSLGLPGVNVLNMICLVVWLGHLRTGRSNAVKPTLRPLFFSLFAVISYAFLITQLTMADDFLEDLMVYKTAIFYPLIYFIFFYVVRSEADARSLTYAILAVAVLAGYEAIREGLDYGNTTFEPMKRASGPFGEDAKTANRAGVFYAMFLAPLLALALYRPEARKPWLRWLAIGGIVVIAAGLFFTWSRQAYLIAGVVAALMMIRRGPAVIVVLLIGLLNYDLWVPTAAVERVAETEQVDERGVEKFDESTESRWTQWSAAGRMIQDKPWGIGLNRFRDLSSSYGGIKQLDAHNHYVLFAAEASPIGLGIHLLLVFALLLLGRRVDRLAKRQGNLFGRALGSGFTFMTLAMILGNIYGSPFASGEVMGLYWAMGGLCARQLLLMAEPAAAAAADLPAGAPAAAAPPVRRAWPERSWRRPERRSAPGRLPSPG